MSLVAAVAILHIKLLAYAVFIDVVRSDLAFHERHRS